MNIWIMTPTATYGNPWITGAGQWISVRESKPKAGVLSKESVKLFSPQSFCVLNNRWLTLLEKIGLNLFLFWVGVILLWLSACRRWQQMEKGFVLVSSLPGTAGLSLRALQQAILQNDVTFTSWRVVPRWEYLSHWDCSLQPNECEGIPNEAVLLV